MEPILLAVILTKIQSVLVPILAAGSLLTVLYGVGAAVSRALGRWRWTAVQKFGLGLTTAMLVVALSGAIGFFHGAYWVIIGIGGWGAAADLFPLLRSAQARSLAFGALKTKCRAHAVPVALGVLYCLARYLAALAPQSHGDPLYYHLTTAWLWAQSGHIQMLDWLPWGLQGGGGEYLYMILAKMVGERMGLLVGAQLVHLTIGLVGSALVVGSLGRLLLPGKLVPWVMLCFLTIPNEPMMLVRAKNDGFVLFLELLSLHALLLWRRDGVAHHLYLVALFSGAAIFVKHTALFFLLPLWTVYFIEFCSARPKWTQGKVWLKAFLLAAMVAPWSMVRNYVWSGNPFFPALDEHFHSPLMNDYLRGVIRGYSVNEAPFWQAMVEQWLRFFGTKPLLILCTLGFLVPAGRVLWLVSTGMLLLLVAVSGAGHYARFGFVLFALGSLLGMGVWEKATGRIKIGSGWRPLILVLLVLVESSWESAFSMAAKRFVPFLFSSRGYSDFFAEDRPETLTHLWANKNLPAGSRILSLFWNENLFSDFPISVPENNLQASEVLLASSYEVALAKFKSGGFTHLQVPPVGRDYMAVLRDHSDFAKNFQKIHEERGVELYVLR